FPSVLDYVRFQLLATPMTALLKDKGEPDRQTIISSVASKTTALATPAMLDGGMFTFPQEAYIAIARSLRAAYSGNESFSVSPSTKRRRLAKKSSLRSGVQLLQELFTPLVVGCKGRLHDVRTIFVSPHKEYVAIIGHRDKVR